MAFSLVGAIGTLAHYSILYVLVEFYKFNPVAASGWGALAGLLVNYCLNYKLTFKSQQSHAQTFPKFALIASLGLGLNLLLMASLTHHLYYLYAQVITTAVVLIWNFFANSFWTFQMDISGNTIDDKPKSVLKKIFTGFGLFATLLALRALSLGLYPLYDPSESRYAEMGRKMLETGNWVTPLIEYGVPFWGKPPMTVWLTASSLWLGGINDFSARLPSFLLSLGVIWIIFNLAKVQRGLEYACGTVIILASTVSFFVMSGTVAMDVCMSLGITLAIASFWLALRDDGKTYWGYLFFIGLSIGLLAKGPIAVVLSGISIGLWTLITGEWKRIWQRIPWIKGTLLMLAISVPWFLIAEHKTPGFLEYFIIGEHWKRFTESGWTGDLYGNGHAQPRGKIWLYWLGAAFPWSLIFLKTVITAAVKKQPQALLRSNDGWRLYCLLWMTAPLFFFTLSANIIWTYPLPGLPGFALLLADWLPQRSKYRTAIALCVPLGFFGLVVAYHCPDLDFFRSQKPLVEAYRMASLADERLVYFGDRPYSAQFYMQGKAVQLTGIPELQASLTETNHDFYVVKDEVMVSLPEAAKLRLEPVKHYRLFTLYHARSLNGR
jgi:putative flippase GtrA